ncbi:MAG: sigma-70 family RNA polymerase sigma factor [Spirochaetia bacterium]|nr:sigma-70 family RNA polymerase sigma factor [Spirochaetia bacterium]
MSNPHQIFEALYNAHRQDLFTYLLRSVKEENTALDLLQDTFLNFIRVFQSREIPDTIGSRKYLFRIARNLTINYSQTAYKRRVDLSGTADQDLRSTAKEPSDLVIDKMEAEERHAVLADLMVRLPEDERTAIELRVGRQMKLEEIADIMDTSISRVSRLVQKGAQRLIHEGRMKGFDFSKNI